jgi:hypothetical protein
MQIRVIKMKFIPIEIVWPRHPTSHNRIEVRVDNLFLGVVLGNPSMVMFDAVNVVFLLLAFTLRWKNLVVASPSLIFAILAHCFFLALSTTHRAITFFFNLSLRSRSPCESALRSCAKSSCNMTSKAACTATLVFENRPRLHLAKLLAIARNLWIMHS